MDPRIVRQDMDIRPRHRSIYPLFTPSVLERGSQGMGGDLPGGQHCTSPTTLDAMHTRPTGQHASSPGKSVAFALQDWKGVGHVSVRRAQPPVMETWRLAKATGTATGTAGTRGA